MTSLIAMLVGVCIVVWRTRFELKRQDQRWRIENILRRMNKRE